MLLGISGKIKSGKDTLAGMLKEQIQHRNAIDKVHIKYYAGKLKDIVALLTGCNRAMLENQDFKATYAPREWNRTSKQARHWLIIKLWMNQRPEDTISDVGMWDDKTVALKAIQYGFRFERTYREMLQEIGTDLFRNQLHPETWINATFADYKPVSGLYKDINYPYPNWIIPDVRFPDEVDAIKQRGGIVIRINRIGTGVNNQVNAHASETALDNYEGFDAIIDNNGTLEELQQKSTELVTKFNLK